MSTLELKKILKLIQENKCPSNGESKITKILGLLNDSHSNSSYGQMEIKHLSKQRKDI